MTYETVYRESPLRDAVALLPGTVAGGRRGRKRDPANERGGSLGGSGR
jgi:hypothetical protein